MYSSATTPIARPNIPIARPTRPIARRATRVLYWMPHPAVLVGGLSLVAVAVLDGLATKDHAPTEATIPAGTLLVAALENTVTTEAGQVGQLIELETVEAVSLDNGKTLPKGVAIRGEVTHTQGGGRIAGGPELTLRFTHMEVDGLEYRIEADPFRLEGKGDLAGSVAEIGGGAVASGVVATKGNQIVLPAGQMLRIRLAHAVTMRYHKKVSDKG